MKRILLITALLTLFNPSFGIILHNQDTSKLSARLNEHVELYVDSGLFSGVILVAKEGKLLYHEAYGYADAKRQIANQKDTKFLVGSTTKSLTATVLMRYYQKGLVKLDEPISTYLPNLKRELGDKLTLHNLLKMQSGLPNHLARLTHIGNDQIDMKEMVNIMNKAGLGFTPGTDYAYSNLNFHLIAAVLENVAGKEFSEILNEELFDLLNMKNSASGSFEAIQKNKALGHHVGSLRFTEKNNLSYATGSGCVHSTAEDLFIWDQALYENSFLTENSKQMVFDGGTEEMGYYGYGFRIMPYDRVKSDLPDGTLARHGGTMRGYLANVHRYIDDKVTVIILGNISMFPIRRMTTELKDIVLHWHWGS